MKYSNITANTLIKTGFGKVAGFIVNSHTNGTLKFWDNTSGATTVLMNTYTFASGSQVVIFPEAVSFNVGLYATVGGTVDLTIVYA